MLLRPGNAGSNTATDHIAVIRAALAQLPPHRPGTRPGRRVLVRTDGAGAPTPCWTGSPASGWNPAEGCHTALHRLSERGTDYVGMPGATAAQEVKRAFVTRSARMDP